MVVKIRKRPNGVNLEIGDQSRFGRVGLRHEHPLISVGARSPPLANCRAYDARLHPVKVLQRRLNL